MSELQEVTASGWSGFGHNPKALVNESGDKVAILSTLDHETERLICFVRPLTLEELQSVMSHLLAHHYRNRKVS